MLLATLAALASCSNSGGGDPTPTLTPDEFTSLVPAPGASVIDLTSFQVNFADSVDFSSVDGSDFSARRQDGTALALSAQIDSTARTATVAFTDTLTPADYTLRIGGDIARMDGTMVPSYEWTVTVTGSNPAPGPDRGALPRVNGNMVPAIWDIGVATDGTAIATFNNRGPLELAVSIYDPRSGGWSQPARVGNSTGIVAEVFADISMSPGGRAAIVYLSADTQGISSLQVVERAPGGNFTAPVRVANDEPDSTPMVAINDSGRVVVGWVDERDHLIVRVGNSGIGSFGATQDLGDASWGGTIDWRDRARVTANGQIVIGVGERTWILPAGSTQWVQSSGRMLDVAPQGTVLAGEFVSDVFEYTVYTPGAGWSTLERERFDNIGGGYAAGVINDAGEITIAWSKIRSATGGDVFTASRMAGSWSNPQDVGDGLGVFVFLRGDPRTATLVFGDYLARTIFGAVRSGDGFEQAQPLGGGLPAATTLNILGFAVDGRPNGPTFAIFNGESDVLFERINGPIGGGSSGGRGRRR